MQSTVGRALKFPFCFEILALNLNANDTQPLKIQLCWKFGNVIQTKVSILPLNSKYFPNVSEDIKKVHKYSKLAIVYLKFFEVLILQSIFKWQKLLTFNLLDLLSWGFESLLSDLQCFDFRHNIYFVHFTSLTKITFIYIHFFFIFISPYTSIYRIRITLI